jgi:hypothetical protein
MYDEPERLRHRLGSSRMRMNQYFASGPEQHIEDDMDRNEKKKLREHIGEHIDVSGTRLSDEDAQELGNFIDNYDNYRGRSTTRTKSFDSWSSDGKYTRDETFTETFTEEVGIRLDYSYKDDDGKSGESSENIQDARGILNKLRGQS